jgi:hypothetical protein
MAAWLGWNVHQVQQRKRMEQYILSIAGDYMKNPTPIIYGLPRKPWKSLPIIWGILGTRSVRIIDLKGCRVTEEDAAQIRKWFPEAEVSI